MKATMKSRQGDGQTAKGFTVVELMIAVVVVAIGVALATPTYENIMQKRQTTAQAEELAAFLSYAQSEALKSNEQVSVELTYSTANNWCIGANEGNSGCDCTEVDSTSNDYCSLNGVAHMMDSSTQTRCSMSAYSADTMFTFDPVRGIMETVDLGNNHAFTMQSDNSHYALQVDVAVTGRIVLCNPDTNKEVPGFELCTSVSVIPLPPL